MNSFERFDERLRHPYRDTGKCEFIGTALAIGLAAASAAGAVGSAAIGAHAAGKAGNAQADAANFAAAQQRQSEKEALQFQKDVYAQQQKDQAPWLQAGQGAIGDLSKLAQDPNFGQWTGSFQAPGADAMSMDPGYQFRLSEGQKALEGSAAARGTLLSGGTLKALDQYTQNFASDEYGKVYGRRFGEYQQGYNEFKQNAADRFNHLASVSGTGQISAGNLGTIGSNTASNVGNILLSSARTQGDYLQNAAAARASGYVGRANAWGGALNQIPNTFLAYQLLQKNGGASAYPTGDQYWDYTG